MLYVLQYVNEDEYRKLERSLKKYNMVAYKKLMFDYYPKLRSGEFVGEAAYHYDDEVNGYLLDVIIPVSLT